MRLHRSPARLDRGINQSSGRNELWGVSPVAAELVFSVLSDGSYRKHLEGLRRRLARARRRTAVRLGALSIRPWIMPRGGFYLWCGLPDDRDAVAVALGALAEDIVLAPGDVFDVSQRANRFMGFNVAQMGDPNLFAVLERALAKAGIEKRTCPARTISNSAESTKRKTEVCVLPSLAISFSSLDVSMWPTNEPAAREGRSR